MPCPPLTQGILGLPHALTGHLQADPIGQGRAKLVAGKALVFPLILLWPPATAEVDHQGTRPPPHRHPGVLGDVEEPTVASPVEAVDNERGGLEGGGQGQRRAAGWAPGSELQVRISGP